MKRLVKLFVAVTAIGALLAPPAQGVPVLGNDVPQDACQPDPTVTGMQTLRCRYGPIPVTPGTNMILLGPVTVESPRADGYIVGTRPDMVDAVTGEVPPIHELHLHHGVWLNPARSGTVPFMAAGEEKTVAEFPAGHGYRTSPADTWILNYMIHNQTGASGVVFITYELDWVPLGSPEAASVRPVDPLWFDVTGKTFYPVYDPVPTGQIDAATGRPIHRKNRTWGTHATNYELIWMAGHVHPGGLRNEVRFQSCGNQPVFTSEARFNPRPGVDPDVSFGSWDFLMTATPDDWRFLLARTDDLTVTTVYDTTNPWYEAMGIVFAWGVPMSDTQFALAKQARPNSCAHTAGRVTRAAPDDEPVFGGDQVLFDPTSIPASGDPVSTVTIAAFTYKPGNLGEAPALVKAGRPVTFANADAAAGIYHSVTQCEGLCNRNYGQSYPRATWGFDSGQLGFGPPEGTAAANRATWTYTPPAGTNELVSYYCRVHPPMRGYLQIVP